MTDYFEIDFIIRSWKGFQHLNTWS